MTDKDLEIAKNAVIVGTANLQHIIARLIAAERDRCARIADAAVNEMNGQRKSGMARAIARKIRSDWQP